uniref:Toxin candidate TRINITY_DN30655_c0_g2_i3 n=1 Tax=Pachycerianthus borealis TaxID=2736680 RepID=A0A7G7WYY4_9CNID|nr:toxin candidate TRINITY_DN30655_c0_g2_i3 [Pachycerianthus borealis]
MSIKLTTLVAVCLFIACATVQSRILRTGKGKGLWGGKTFQDSLENELMDYSVGGCPDAKEALKLHNQLRRKHGAEKLRWDDKLAQDAQAWAENNAANGVMAHSTEEQRNFQGENLAFLWVGLPELENTAAQEGTKMWIEEEPLYPVDPMQALHFTQMVWKKTTNIGIGCAKSGDMVYVCARYNPRGNFESFTENVQM